MTVRVLISFMTAEYTDILIDVCVLALVNTPSLKFAITTTFSCTLNSWDLGPIQDYCSTVSPQALFLDKSNQYQLTESEVVNHELGKHLWDVQVTKLTPSLAHVSILSWISGFFQREKANPTVRSLLTFNSSLP